MFTELQSILGVQSVAEMLDVLNLSRHIYQRYRNQGLLPWEELGAYCADRGLSMDEFLYGRAPDEGVLVRLAGELVKIEPSGLQIGLTLTDVELEWLKSHIPEKGVGELSGVYMFEDPKGVAGTSTLPGYLVVQMTIPDHGFSGFSDGDHIIVLAQNMLVMRRLVFKEAGVMITTTEGAAVEQREFTGKGSARRLDANGVVGKVLGSMKLFSSPIHSDSPDADDYILKPSH